RHEAGLGVAPAAAGTLGDQGGKQDFIRGRIISPAVEGAPRVIRGTLRAAPGFVAQECGPSAPFGTEIPMEKAPDGSYVRSERGEWAQREPRGYLPAGPDYFAPEAGAA